MLENICVLPINVFLSVIYERCLCCGICVQLFEINRFILKISAPVPYNRLDNAGNARFHAPIYPAVVKILSVSRTFLQTTGKDLIRKRAFWRKSLRRQTELSLTGSRFIVKVFPASRQVSRPRWVFPIFETSSVKYYLRFYPVTNFLVSYI